MSYQNKFKYSHIIYAYPTRIHHLRVEIDIADENEPLDIYLIR
jgi:hypothetical protein